MELFEKVLVGNEEFSRGFGIESHKVLEFRSECAPFWVPEVTCSNIFYLKKINFNFEFWLEKSSLPK